MPQSLNLLSLPELEALYSQVNERLRNLFREGDPLIDPQKHLALLRVRREYTEIKLFLFHARRKLSDRPPGMEEHPPGSRAMPATMGEAALGLYLRNCR